MSSDLSTLEELGATLAPAQDQPPAEVRHRVMNGMRHPVRRQRLLSRLRGVRLAWRIGASAAAAAAVSAALVAGQLADIVGERPAPPGRGADVEAAPPGRGPNVDAPPPAPLDARQVMLLAAQHAAATPALDARPNQFLFIDSVEVQSTLDDSGTHISDPLRTRTWLSVDGTRDGLVLQQANPPVHLDGCKNGLQAETIDRPETTRKVACTPEPAYLPGRVPTDPDRLRAYVYKIAAAEPTFVSVGPRPDGKKPEGYVRLSTDQRAFMEIAGILYKNHLPAVQEAAFRVAGQIPGVQVRRNVADAAGRVGVAVTRTEAGSREELVFDRATYRYLGHNIIAAEFDLTGTVVVRTPNIRGRLQIQVGSNPAPGEVIYKSALLRVAIVDKAGRRP